MWRWFSILAIVRKSGWPDLALLKLEKPLPDRFIPAYFGGYTPHNGDGLIAAGYGEGFPVPLLKKWVDKVGF